MIVDKICVNHPFTQHQLFIGFFITLGFMGDRRDLRFRFGIGVLDVLIVFKSNLVKKFIGAFNIQLSEEKGSKHGGRDLSLNYFRGSRGGDFELSLFDYVLGEVK